MAVVELSAVTETLIWLMRTGIETSEGWSPMLPFEVSPLPPDRLRDSGTNLGFYLYHLAEDAHFKNPPPSGGGAETRPIALNLYYQLTCQVGELDGDALRAQRLIGCAVKVLHDFPVISDGTTIVDAFGNPQTVLAQHDLLGRGNRIAITLRPVPPDDAVDYWTAGEAPLRLAAYYQVSVIFLEHTPEPTSASPVLTYGSGVFATGAPWLASSRATLSVVVARDPFAASVRVQPAQVSLGDRFELEGSSLTGTSTSLQLRDEDGVRRADPAAWGIVATPGRVYATPSPALGAADLLPGTWQVSVGVQRSVPVGGATRSIEHTSNEMPMVITPRLDPLAPVGPTLGSAAPGAVVVWNGWLFEHERIPTEPSDPGSLRLYIGEHIVGSPDLVIVDASTLQVTLPSTLVPGTVVPVRVAVRGAVSAPRWLEVT